LVRARHVEPVVVIGDEGILPINDPHVILDFVGLVLMGQDRQVFDFIDEARAHGSSVGTIYLGLMTETARLMGQMWENDQLHFADVTLGMLRLQQLVKNYSSAFQTEGPHRNHGKRAMLVAGPGEQHGLGLSILSEFLHRAGWSIAGGPGISVASMERLVQGDWFTLVGFSVTCDSRLDALRDCITRVRRASYNQRISVMVGGALFMQHPDWVKKVGADCTAADARQATLLAESLLTRSDKERIF
jgi:methanogenic corrinoid protein MtbC1